MIASSNGCGGLRAAVRGLACEWLCRQALQRKAVMLLPVRRTSEAILAVCAVFFACAAAAQSSPAQATPAQQPAENPQPANPQSVEPQSNSTPGSPTQAEPAQPAPEWKTFSFPDEGFSALFPSQPAKQKQSVPADKVTLELRSYTVETAAMAVEVGVCDYGDAIH
jgi:hypothetical protein